MESSKDSGGMSIGVYDSEADDEELARLTAQLRQELLELDTVSVEFPTRGTAPEGTRAGEVVALGALVVGLIGSPDVIRRMVDVIGSWVSGSRSRSVRMEFDGDELELSGVSVRDQRRLIDEWIRRHEF